MRAATLLIACLLVAGCMDDEADEAATDRSLTLARGLDLIGTEFAIAGQKAGQRYRVFAAFRSARAAEKGDRRFHGFECGQSCSDNQAGFAWAKGQGVTAPNQCIGPTWGFVEGCAAYLIERRS